MFCFSWRHWWAFLLMWIMGCISTGVAWVSQGIRVPRSETRLRQGCVVSCPRSMRLLWRKEEDERCFKESILPRPWWSDEYSYESLISQLYLPAPWCGLTRGGGGREAAAEGWVNQGLPIGPSGVGLDARGGKQPYRYGVTHGQPCTEGMSGTCDFELFLCEKESFSFYGRKWYMFSICY